MTQRKNVDIGPVITMTRNAYRLVKIAPFVYAMIYIMCLFGYLMFNDTVSAMIDVLCYISPVPVIYNLLLSKALWFISLATETSAAPRLSSFRRTSPSR